MIALFFFFKLRVLECGDSRRNIVLKQSHLASHAKARVVVPNFNAVEFMVVIEAFQFCLAFPIGVFDLDWRVVKVIHCALFDCILGHDAFIVRLYSILLFDPLWCRMH